MALKIFFHLGSTNGVEGRLQEFQHLKKELARRREELELEEEAVDSAIEDLETALRNHRND
jgi:hypothetical protein